MGPCLGQVGVERRQGFVRKLGQLAAQFRQAVDGHHADPAAVGHDRQALALELGRAGQGFDGGEDFVDGIDPQHPGAAERGVIDCIGPGQGPGMRGGGGGPGAAAPGLDHQDGFVACGGPPGGHEFAPLVDRFHIQQDRPGVRIAAQIVEYVAEIRVDGIAHGDEVRKADAARPRPIEHRRAQRARLAGEGDIAGQGGQVGKTGVQPRAGDQQAQAVRPQNAHAVLARGRQDLRLRRAVAVPIGRGNLVQPGGQDDRGHGAAGAKVFDDLRHRRRGGADHRHVGGQGQGRHVGIGQDPGDGGMVAVDRHDRSAEPALQQVVHHQIADRALALGRADNGDGGGVEQFIEIADAHASNPVVGIPLPGVNGLMPMVSLFLLRCNNEVWKAFVGLDMPK